MAKKVQTVFVCQNCGYESPRWMGRCVCGAWNSFVEEKVGEDKHDSRRRTGRTSVTESGKTSSGRPVPLSHVKSGETDRIDTGIPEFNRVLGGGLVRGSLTLISGEPGIGKSTLILQAASNIAACCGKVLYVSGEESEEQIKIRADRICGNLSENLYILSETNMENVLTQFAAIRPVFMIIDSIQTMYTENLDSAPGSVSQVRDCGAALMKAGKENGTPILIVAHVTKSGELAGPRTVEHMVDTVLQFNGERSTTLRILRAVKNRFGTTNEISAFEMGRSGLMPVENLSESLMQDMEDGTEGSVATAVYEGTRPLILEVQALTTPTPSGFPRRQAIGVDIRRLNMIIAVLERHAGISLANQDVYVNIVGGIRPEGTSYDLAAALAIYSSYIRKAPPENTIILGEIGLTGGLRSVQFTDRIVSEAKRLGFKRIIMPGKNAARFRNSKKPTVTGVSSISEALHLIG
ncbi:MAG: DNA repair protein RadA [Eubacteriales bacterium]|jgi:DNA repair protein RadA/Sms|nr:DNA repair protein RadA [Eubacteriales bacterium]